MGENTGISWTDHTFNPWWGCAKVSPGCANCYAEAFSSRTGHEVWGPKSRRRLFGLDHWKEPLKWNDKAKSDGKPHHVFCGSMCDVFEKHPDTAEEFERLCSLIRLTPNLTWQLLTKRPERIKGTCPADILNQPNVWVGTSAEDQERWNLRVPVLVSSGAAVTFVSAEPLIGPVNPGPELFMLDWLVIGGESGAKKRQCDVAWIVDLARDAEAGGVAVWVKQDSALKPGQQGRIPDEIWKMKSFPKLAGQSNQNPAERL